MATSENQSHNEGVSVLEVFLDLILHFGLWIICGSKPGLGLAIFVNHKLCEIPLDGVQHETTLLVLQIDPEWMGISAIYVDFAEHVKGDIVLLSSKCLDFLIRAGLLGIKLIARKSQNTQTSSFRVLVVHLYQLPGHSRF